MKKLFVLLALCLFASPTFASVCGVDGITYDETQPTIPTAYPGACYVHNVDLNEAQKDYRASKIDPIFTAYISDQTLSPEGVELAIRLNQAIADLTHQHVMIHMGELKHTTNREALSHALAIYEFVGNRITHVYLDERNHSK